MKIWLKTIRGRDVFVEDLMTTNESGLDIENAKDEFVISAMQSAPSYPALLKAYHRFKRSLYKDQYNPKEIENKPWEMIGAHCGVFNAKSQTCKTLRALEEAVLAESKLPFTKPDSLFRLGIEINWDSLACEALRKKFGFKQNE